MVNLSGEKFLEQKSEILFTLSLTFVASRNSSFMNWCTHSEHLPNYNLTKTKTHLTRPHLTQPHLIQPHLIQPYLTQPTLDQTIA